MTGHAQAVAHDTIGPGQKGVLCTQYIIKILRAWEGVVLSRPGWTGLMDESGWIFLA